MPCSANARYEDLFSIQQCIGIYGQKPSSNSTLMNIKLTIEQRILLSASSIFLLSECMSTAQLPILLFSHI